MITDDTARELIDLHGGKSTILPKPIPPETAACVRAIEWLAGVSIERRSFYAQNLTVTYPHLIQFLGYIPSDEECGMLQRTVVEAAKLLMKALEIVIVKTEKGNPMPYWKEDWSDFVKDHRAAYITGESLLAIPDFIIETDPASSDFHPGHADTEALVKALIAAGAKEVES